MQSWPLFVFILVAAGSRLSVALHRLNCIKSLLLQESPLLGKLLYSGAPIKTHNYYICVVVGGDKSASLNNLLAWRRREMRDLKVLHREWKALICLSISLSQPLSPFPLLSSPISFCPHLSPFLSPTGFGMESYCLPQTYTYTHKPLFLSYFCGIIYHHGQGSYRAKL